MGEINYTLINAREALGLNRREISDAIGIPIMIYGSYEAGRMNPPKKRQDKIVEFFEDKGLLVHGKYLFQNGNVDLESNLGKELDWDF